MSAGRVIVRAGRDTADFGRRVVRRTGRVGALALVVLGTGIGVTLIVPPAPRLVWNVSASAPVGLYGVSPGAAVARGDMVVARVPLRWRRLAAVRRYIPENVPLVKRVAAGAGDRVCAIGAEIRVNGTRVAVRRAVDGHARTMPAWGGCVTLRDGMLLLLMDAPDSFDGRYFGPTAAGDIIGKARSLWRA